MKIFKIVVFVLILLCAYAYLSLFSSYVFPWQKKEAIQTTLNWGGLNNIPENAENITVEKEGNLFTRTFIVKFTSSKSEIQNWIKTSKRLKSNPSKIENKKEIYKIYPGENESLGGNVEIEQNNVKIKMSWS